MKLIFTALRRTGSTADLRELGFAGELNFADCAATLLPWDEALEQPFRIVFAGPAAGTMSSTRLGAALEDANLLCADVGGTSSDISLVVGGPSVRQQHVRARARPGRQRALDRDRRASAPAAAASSRSRRRARCRSAPSSAGAEPGPACYGRGGTAPTITDACLLMGILDPDAFAGGELRARRRPRRGAAFEALDTAAELRPARRVRVPDRGRTTSPRRSSTSRSATASTRATSRSSPTARPARCCCPRCSTCCSVARIVVPPHPGLFSALGLLSTDLVFSDSRSAYILLTPDGGAGDRPPLLRDGGAACAARVGAAGVTVRRSFDGRLFGQSWETPFVDVPDGPITADTIARADRALPRRVRAALRQPLRDGPGPGRDLPRAARRAGREGARTSRSRERRRRAGAAARSSCATSPDEMLAGRGVRARAAAGAAPACAARPSSASRRRPRSSARDRCATVGRLRRDRHRTGGPLMLRDLDDAGVRRPLRLRSLHRHGARQPLPLPRRAHVQPAAHDRVLADPARLLRLRRHHHGPAAARLPDAGDERTASCCSPAR